MESHQKVQNMLFEPVFKIQSLYTSSSYPRHNCTLHRPAAILFVRLFDCLLLLFCLFVCLFVCFIFAVVLYIQICTTILSTGLNISSLQHISMEREKPTSRLSNKQQKRRERDLELYTLSRQLRSSFFFRHFIFKNTIFGIKSSGQRSFSYQGPSTWYTYQQLSYTLRHAHSFKSFES